MGHLRPKKARLIRALICAINQDKEMENGAAAGRGVMQRIGAARDVWLQGLSSGAASSGSASPRGFVGPVGARRSTRRVRVAPAKQDLFTGGGAEREPRVAHPG